MPKSRSFFKRSGIANSIFTLGPFLPLAVIGIISALNFSNPFSLWFWTGGLTMLAGWAMLVRAKWPQLRKGDLFSFGMHENSSAYLRRMYWQSYALMFAGYLVTTTSGLL